MWELAYFRAVVPSSGFSNSQMWDDSWLLFNNGDSTSSYVVPVGQTDSEDAQEERYKVKMNHLYFYVNSLGVKKHKQ